MNKAAVNTFLRTKEMWEQYQNCPATSGCFLCKSEVIATYTYWYICKNNFHYDAVAEIHHMLVPLQHVSHESELSPGALEELKAIMSRLDVLGTYDSIMRNFVAAQSHPSHLHYHLITWKRDEYTSQ